MPVQVHQQMPARDHNRVSQLDFFLGICQLNAFLFFQNNIMLQREIQEIMGQNAQLIEMLLQLGVGNEEPNPSIDHSRL